MEEHWSAYYLRDMEKMPGWIPEAFQKRACGTIDKEAVLDMLQAQGWAQSTIDLRLRMVMAVVNYRPRHKKSKAIHILEREKQKAVFDACETQGERWTVGLLL